MNDISFIPELKSRMVRLVGVACGYGARDRRCEVGPDALRAANITTRLQSRGFKATWAGTLRPRLARHGDVVNAVASICERLAERVEGIVTDGDLPVVIGGDHSCAVGTWKGAARALRDKGPLGLIWIDAHMDAHTPQTSLSGAVHGMPLAALFGYGDERMTALAAGEKLDPQHVCLIGVRSFESGEAELLRNLGVRIFFMDEVARRGLDSVFQEALEIVQSGTAGFGVTLDLDALDPQHAPGVGSPVAGGLQGAELIGALSRLAGDADLVALEIVEYNPYRDAYGATVGLVLNVLEAILGGQQTLPLPATPMEIEQRYGSHHYDPMPVVLTRGKGVYLWDDQGRRYLDMMSAYSAVSHGHCHPRLTRVLTQQAQTLAVTSRAYYNNRLPYLLRRLCQLTGQDLALPANTGLEAVEAALKTARKWGAKAKGIPQADVEIIACEGNFHGRSIAIVAMSSEPQYRDGFGPFPPGYRSIPYADAAALERAITPNTAAFLVEPIQGEGGIIVPPAGYLTACADICRRHNVLLICDEVQTGLGRTGCLLASDHEKVKPDGLILGKALGGGLLPISAFLARRDVLGVLKPGDHGSTFGGNPLAAAVALEAIDVLIEEGLIARAANLGQYLLDSLRALESPLISDVRGLGLLAGVEFDSSLVSARTVCETLLRHGVLTKDTHGTVVRFAPPLVITKQQLDWGLMAIRDALEEIEADLAQTA